MARATPEQEDAFKKKIRFQPCRNIDDLHRWIRIFLGLDLPRHRVYTGDTTHEGSTSSPMELIWEIYDAGLRNDTKQMARIMAYASRDSFKTLGAAILEVLVVLHLKRSVAHMAAIQSQADKCQSYVKSFFDKPYLRDFVEGDAKKSTKIIRCEHRETGENLTKKEWEALPDVQRDAYEVIERYINVVICTMAGANSEHTPFFVVDEVDVVPNPAAYEQAKAIPAPLGRLLPITLLTSTRKFNFGLVQKELDNAIDARGRRKLQVRHWNILDVTTRCPNERHRPDLPKLPIYHCDDDLTAISQEDYEALPTAEKGKFKETEGYTGCLTNCRMFALCQGKLATRKTNMPLSAPCWCGSDLPYDECHNMLKPVDSTENTIGSVSVDMAHAEYLCWKPSSAGLIYPRFSREKHVISAARMAFLITGEEQDEKTFGKAALLKLMRRRGIRFVAGMDHGMRHNFACVSGGVDGKRCFIFDCASSPGLELDQRISLCKERFTGGRWSEETKTHWRDMALWVPDIWPDTEDPASNKTFKRHGFKMRKWVKKPHSVKGGIEQVRIKLAPALGGEPELYFLDGDPGVQVLVDRLAKYHWIIGPDGLVTNVPDETDDDECDALRYLVLNVFGPKGKVKAPHEDSEEEIREKRRDTARQEERQQNWLGQAIQESVAGLPLGSSTDDHDPAPATEAGECAGRRGGFFWSM